MTARHKKKARKRRAEAVANSHASAARRRRESRGRFFLGILITLAIAAALVGMNVWIEEKDIGRRVESMTYDLLQQRLSAADLEKITPVVVSISGIQMRPTLGLTPALVTDRVPLKMVVDSLVTRPDHPSAIGLDVDFSPDSHGYADPEDPRLFDGLLADGGTVPIRIGVNRSLALGRGYWLGNPNYLPLASCVVVPNADPGQSSRYMPEWIDVPYPPPGSEPERCYSMGVALVKAIGKEPPSWRSWYAESYRENRGTHISENEFLVDYSQLDKMIGATVDALDPAQLARANVKGKIVLLGRTQNTSDMFTVPGKPEQSYPGVYLHACAALSLLEARPLYRLTGKGRILFDLLFSGLVLIPLIWIQWRSVKKGEEGFMERGSPELLSFAVTAGLVVIALAGVRWTHLMWDDFLLVAAALVLHSPIEHAVEKIGHLLGRLGFWRPNSSTASRPHPESE
jgi:CHASE2 domain-containing sensor protein